MARTVYAALLIKMGFIVGHLAQAGRLLYYLFVCMKFWSEKPFVRNAISVIIDDNVVIVGIIQMSNLWQVQFEPFELKTPVICCTAVQAVYTCTIDDDSKMSYPIRRSYQLAQFLHFIVNFSFSTCSFNALVRCFCGNEAYYLVIPHDQFLLVFWSHLFFSEQKTIFIYQL